MTADDATTVRRESRLRGMLLGLALGDGMVGRRGDPLRGTATTQLACFTTEGLVRALVRRRLRGISHEPSVIWHATLRWAAVQGIPGVPVAARTDGWLATVPALHRRRGDAPAVVAALRAHRVGFSPSPSTSTSSGHHALTRLVALAAGVGPDGTGQGVRLAPECAAATHGHPEVPDAVARGIAVLGAALHGTAPSEDRGGGAPPLTARAALEGAVEVVGEHPGRGRVTAALSAAAAHPAGPEGVAPLAGALLGALHGVEALPPDVWRLELGHVVDTLARDLAVEAWSPRSEDADPEWAARYPGS